VKIGVIDYNINNLSSVLNSISKLGFNAEIVKNADDISSFDKIILPGVGAFGDAMLNLEKSNMDNAIKEFAKSGKYILGICLGMQLLFNKSCEFTNTTGLSLVDSDILYFDKKDGYKVPHMGWNIVECDNNKIFDGIDKKIYLYFVHSLYAKTGDFTIGKSWYANEFSSIVNIDNIYGIQAHPEKSHDVGLKLIDNFLKL
jgi:glutamine amidotransferase